MRNKRASHVGVVLSFVIFITFIVFIYSVLESPTKVKQEKEPLLEHVQRNIIENVTGNVKLTTLETAGMSGGCISLKEIGLSGKNFIAKDFDGNIVGSGATNNIDGSANLVKVYSTKEYLNNLDASGCESTLEKNYDYGLVRSDEYIMVSKIKELIDYINQGTKNYKKLKIEFGIQENEFDFMFYNSSGESIGFESEEASTSIYSEEIPVTYFDENAKINIGRLRIRVW